MRDGHTDQMTDAERHRVQMQAYMTSSPTKPGMALVTSDDMEDTPIPQERPEVFHPVNRAARRARAKHGRRA